MIKICGVTREAELDALGRLGVDFAGLCAFPGRPYSLTPTRAAELARSARSVCPVLVTVETDPDRIASLIDQVRPAAVQLSGLMRPSRLRELRTRLGSAAPRLFQGVHVQGTRVLEARPEAFFEAGAELLIVDSVGEALGSTGIPISEAVLDRLGALSGTGPFLLAGGVRAENVRPMLDRSSASGVDVCSSVRDPEGRVSLPEVERLLAAIRKEPA